MLRRLVGFASRQVPACVRAMPGRPPRGHCPREVPRRPQSSGRRRSRTLWLSARDRVDAACFQASGLVRRVPRPAGRERSSRIDRISTASPISRSSPKLARKTAWTKSGSQGSYSALVRHATRAARRPSRGRRDGLANGTQYFAHRRSMSRHMYCPFAR